MSKLVNLLIIDPQNDFCTPLAPGADPKTAVAGFTKAALLVGGAAADMNRLASFITKNSKRIDEINVTLDSHQTVHIAHPIFWVNSKGNHPDPFTIITSQDVRDGVWRAYNPRWQARAQVYVDTLAKNKRYELCIWPPHCRIGTWGHSIVPEVAEALYKWEVDNFNKVSFITKGSNFFTEHYSAVRADVPDDTDASTKTNVEFIDALRKADEIVVAGEALSHCLANSVRDTATEFGNDKVSKFTLLEDASSNVYGCEKLGEDFIKDMTKLGMRRTTTKDW